RQEPNMLAGPSAPPSQIHPSRPGSPAVARMFCDIHTPEGGPFEGDPRHVLRRAIARASELGVTFYAGPEIEFFLFKDAHDPEPLDAGSYFDLTPLDVGSDFRRKVITG